MMQRTPPKFAGWLLKRWGSSYRGESLAGDLIEQYQQGRGRAWYWRQVIAAIFIARLRIIRTVPWAAAGRTLSRLFAETSAVLAVTLIVDRARRVHSQTQMMNHCFIGILVGLIAVALIGFLLSNRPGRGRQRRAAIDAMVLAFGVIALGAGTLAWAGATRADAIRADAIRANAIRSGAARTEACAARVCACADD